MSHVRAFVLVVVGALAAAVTVAPAADARERPWWEGDQPTSITVLAGQVTLPTGVAAPGALVLIYQAGTAVPTGDLDGAVHETETDASGRWSVSSDQISPGSVIIRAGLAGFDARWYGGATPELATAVTVDADLPQETLDIRLAPSARLTGTVRANGAKLAQMQVTAEPLADLGPEVDRASLQTLTLTGGRFGLAVPSGPYRIAVTDPSGGLPARWYPAARTQSAGAIVTVVGGQVVDGVDVDASFQPNFPGRPRARPHGLTLPGGMAARPMDRLGGYDGQRTCRHSPRVGTVALARLLRRAYGDHPTGLNRACGSDTSEHYDGRAIDWMVNSADRRQARLGDDFVKWLTMSRGRDVGAMARRLGVMYVIWRNRIWKSYYASDGWSEYNGCQAPRFAPGSFDSTCHRNHVHISLTRAGAARATSWWSG